jgi:glycosyltransferase involved in cell wall biosynthesis
LLCGKPVITSTSSSIMQIWGECPDILFINQGDIGTLLDFVKRFQPYESMNGREWVIEHLSYDKVGDEYIKIFEEII